MSLILQIETSTSSCSVALSENGTVLAVKELNERNIHASLTTVFVDEVMKDANKPFSSLTAVAVSMGPGSYTGLRIGVSVAKGICYALDIPLISISTLKAMAFKMRQIKGEKDLLYCPMIDARRMEVYTGVFDFEGNEVLPVEAKIIDSSSFAGWLEEKKMIFFGDGASKCQPVLAVHQNAFFEDQFTNSAADLSMLAFEKYKLSQFEDVAYFEPYYLKDFIVGKKVS